MGAAEDDPEKLRQAIKEIYPGLPAAMKKFAKFALDAPVDVSLQPLRTVAERSGAGTTTIIRFARRLGFSSYGAFRDRFRATLRHGTSQYSDRGRSLIAQGGADALTVEIAAVAQRAIADSFAAVDPAAVGTCASFLMAARNVYVLGTRSAFAPAFYLSYLLSMLRPSVRIVEGRFGMLPEEIGAAGPEDVAVAISFEPYARQTVETAALLKGSGVRILAISDSLVSPLAAFADPLIEVATTSPSFYISFGPVICMIEAIVAASALELGEAAVASLQAGDSLRGRPGTYWQAGARAPKSR